MTATYTNLINVRAVPSYARPIALGERVVRMWREWLMAREAASSAADLAEADDRMLADVGVSRSHAEFLSGNPRIRKWWRG